LREEAQYFRLKLIFVNLSLRCCAQQQGIGIIVIKNIFATRFVTCAGPFGSEDDFDRIVGSGKILYYATPAKRGDYV